MPPNLGAADRGGRRGPSRASSTSRCSTRGPARCCELVEQGMAALGREEAASTSSEHHALARRAAAESAVLLKNDGGMLPLSRPRQPGGGDRRVRPDAALPGRRQLPGQPDPGRRRRWTSCARRSATASTFAAGFGIGGHERRTRRCAPRRSRWPAERDHVVVFLGLPGAAESEGFDRTHMDLPANQLAACWSAVGPANRLVVVVLANGSVGRSCRPGSTRTPARSWSAGWAARPPAGRSPTC